MADAVGRIWLLILFLVTIQYAATQQTDDLTEDAFNVSTELCRIYGATSELPWGTGRGGGGFLEPALSLYFFFTGC